MRLGRWNQDSERTQGIRPAVWLTLLLLVAVGSALPGFAQKNPNPGRKVVTYVKPEYPAMLKSMHIEGMVRLTAIVLPNGSVAAIQVRGGNPILVENAIKAVKTWKYAPAAGQTEEEVVLDFGK